MTESLSEHSGSRASISMAESLFRAGNVVDLYATEALFSPELKRRLEDKGLKVFIVKSLFPSLLGKFFSKIPAGFKAGFLIRRGKYDLIFFNGNVDLLPGLKIASLPIITTYYGTQYVGDPFKDKIIEWRTRLLTALSDKVVAISRFTKKELEENFGCRQVEMIYLGIESPVTREGVDKAEGSGPIKIFSLSRFVPYKGFLDLVFIIKELVEEGESLEATIAGAVQDNDYYLKVREAVRGLPIKVVLNPDDNEVNGLFRYCDIYASCTSWEGFGLPFLEAAYFGKPSVGLNRASINEVIEDGESGLLAQSLEDFKFKLRQLITDGVLRARLGSGARELAQRFSWISSSESYVRLFSEVLKERKG